MIDTSLDFLSKILDTHLRNVSSATDQMAHLSHVADDRGVVIPDKSIGVSLVNIEEERIFKDQSVHFINQDGVVEKRNPEIKLNLYVLMSANYLNQDQSDGATDDDYIEGLKQLSNVISFFQARNVFTPDSYPLLASIDPKIQKLVVELYSYTFEQMYNFWSVVGTKYLPSVLYKVRLLTIQEEEVIGLDLPIEKIRIDGKNQLIHDKYNLSKAV